MKKVSKKKAAPKKKASKKAAKAPAKRKKKAKPALVVDQRFFLNGAEVELPKDTTVEIVQADLGITTVEALSLPPGNLVVGNVAPPVLEKPAFWDSEVAALKKESLLTRILKALGLK
mgnify:CR=1 FL=1